MKKKKTFVSGQSQCSECFITADDTFRKILGEQN